MVRLACGVISERTCWPTVITTGEWLACALKIGAVLAKAAPAEVERIGSLGEHLGLAFQLRDDLLDAFGDPDKVGKQQGGDLRAGKKTWLLIRGLEKSREAGRKELQQELNKAPEQRDVARMIAALEEMGIRAEAEAVVADHERAARAALDAIAVQEERKLPLRGLVDRLMARTH